MEEEKDYYNTPTGTAGNLILDVIGAADEVDRLPARRAEVAKDQLIEIKSNSTGTARRVRSSKGNAEIMLEIGDVDKLTRSHGRTKKLLVFALIKANEQAIHGGTLTKEAVTFPLQELIDIGLYESLSGARRGFLAGISALTSLKVQGRIPITKKQESTIDRLEVLFTGGAVKNNMCMIRFNAAIDWGFIVQYFTLLPRYYFSLSNRASDLLYYVFYLARQNVKQITEAGRFNISLKAIQHRLKLPFENETKNPNRDIKREIEKTVQEINAAQGQSYSNSDLRLTMPEGSGAVVHFLKGCITVCFSGALLEAFKGKRTESGREKTTGAEKKKRIFGKDT